MTTLVLVDRIIVTQETGAGEEERGPPKEVKKPEPFPEILYFPSFFKDKISLKFTQSSKNPLLIVLYNSSGASVFEKTLDYTPSSLFLEDKKIQKLPKGIYFLSVKSGRRNLGKIKLIKE